MISELYLLAFFVAVSLAGSPVPPTWPLQYQVVVDMENKVSFLEGSWKSHFYYDFVHKLLRVDHLQGQVDQNCFLEHERRDECHHIVSGNWRYLYWPSLNNGDEFCCRCCNLTSGCGLVKPTWLEGAEYVGLETFGNRTCNGWMIRGFETNYFYQDDFGIPCGIVMNGTLHWTQAWTYEPLSYKVGPIPSDVFAVPPICHGADLCHGWCHLLRKHTH